MPKLKLNLGADAANIEATKGFTSYDGPVPPKGVYPARVKSLTFKTSKTSGNPMLEAIVEFDAPKSDPRSKYNGYAIWDYLVIPTDKTHERYARQVGDINALLDAMSGGNKAVRKALWSDQAVISDDKDPKILKIGPLELKKGEGAAVKVNTKDEVEQRRDKETGEVVSDRRLRVNSYNPADEAQLGKDADEDDEFDPSDIDPADDYDEDDDVEPEPVKKPAARRRRKPEPEPEPEDDEDDEDVSDDPTDYDEDEEPEKVAAAKAKRRAQTEDDSDPAEDAHVDEHVDVAEVPDEDDEEEVERPRRRRRASF